MRLLLSGVVLCADDYMFVFVSTGLVGVEFHWSQIDSYNSTVLIACFAHSLVTWFWIGPKFGIARILVEVENIQQWILNSLIFSTQLILQILRSLQQMWCNIIRADTNYYNCLAWYQRVSQRVVMTRDLSISCFNVHCSSAISGREQLGSRLLAGQRACEWAWGCRPSKEPR